MNSLIKLNGVLLLSLMLTACGGSSDSKPTPIPIPTPPTPTVEKTLTLTGQAIDAPIANAVITTIIAGKTFTVTADSDGLYQLPIILTEQQIAAGAMLTIYAQGEDSQAAAALTSIVGTIDALYQAADDGVLSSDDNQRLNVTHVSTAKYLLVVDANSDQVPATTQDLQTLEQALGGEEVINLASVIKLIIDHPDYTLAEGETTLSVLNAENSTPQEQVQQFLTAVGAIGEDGQVSQEYQAAFDAAVAATLSDDTVIPGFTAEMLVGTNFVSQKVQPGQAVWYASGLIVNADGSGFYSQSVAGVQTSSDLSWTIEHGALDLTVAAYHTTSGVSVMSERLQTDFGFSQALTDFLHQKYQDGALTDSYIEVMSKTTKINYQLITQNQGQIEVSNTATINNHLDSSLLQQLGWTGVDEKPQISHINYQTMYLHSGTPTVNLEQSDISGVWALPMLNEWKSYFDNGEILTQSHQNLVTLGTNFNIVREGEVLEGVSWQKTAQGFELADDQDRIHYQLMIDHGYFYSTIVSEYHNDQLSHITIRPIVKQSYQLDQMSDFLITQLPQFILSGFNAWQATHFNSDNKLKDHTLFGYLINNDGSMDNLFPWQSDALCKNSAKACVVQFDIYSGWSVATNNIELVGTHNANGGFRSRMWYPLAISNGRLSVLEYEIMHQQPDPTLEDSYRIMPRINTLMVEDLNDWSALWQNSNLNLTSTFTTTLINLDGSTLDVELTRGQSFTEQSAIGTYTFTDIDAGGTSTLVLSANGSGQLTCCSGTETNPVTWQILANGDLYFIEADDQGDQFIHTITPIIHDSYDVLLRVTTPAGQSDSININILFNITKT